MDDFAKAYQDLLSSPLGKDLLKELRQLQGGLTDEAAKAQTPDTAFGLLKEAGGVIKAIEHLQFLSAVVPTAEGGK